MFCMYDMCLFLSSLSLSPLLYQPSVGGSSYMILVLPEVSSCWGREFFLASPRDNSDCNWCWLKLARSCPFFSSFRKSLLPINMTLTSSQYPVGYSRCCLKVREWFVILLISAESMSKWLECYHFIHFLHGAQTCLESDLLFHSIKLSEWNSMTWSNVIHNWSDRLTDWSAAIRNIA